MKTHECLQWRARLHDRGLVSLPALRPTDPQGPRRIVWTTASDAPAPITRCVRDLEPVRLTVVTTADDRARWTELIDRYHYLRVRVPVGAQLRHLASAILARAARHLPDNWEAASGTRPLLLKTLVDAQRFAGTCYRAANWRLLGDTQGRGRMDRHHAAHGVAPKRIFVYPLVRDVQRRLCQTMSTLTRSSAP